MSFFTNHGELIKVKSEVRISRDSKDDFLLALAIDRKASHLITGDEDLLVLKKIKKQKFFLLVNSFRSKNKGTNHQHPLSQ